MLRKQRQLFNSSFQSWALWRTALACIFLFHVLCIQEMYSCHVFLLSKCKTLSTFLSCIFFSFEAYTPERNEMVLKRRRRINWIENENKLLEHLPILGIKEDKQSEVKRRQARLDILQRRLQNFASKFLLTNPTGQSKQQPKTNDGRQSVSYFL